MTAAIGLLHVLLAPMNGCKLPQCEGSPTACVDFSSDDCSSQLGCWFDDYGYCDGNPVYTDCLSLPEGVCTTIPGCSWSGGSDQASGDSGGNGAPTTSGGAGGSGGGGPGPTTSSGSPSSSAGGPPMTSTGSAPPPP